MQMMDANGIISFIGNREKKTPVKVIEIQRSKGYSTRKSITTDTVKKVISLLKDVSPDTIVMIDK